MITTQIDQLFQDITERQIEDMPYLMADRQVVDRRGEKCSKDEERTPNDK